MKFNFRKFVSEETRDTIHFITTQLYEAYKESPNRDTMYLEKPMKHNTDFSIDAMIIYLTATGQLDGVIDE